NLAGTTDQGTAVNVSATTDAAGAFSFLNVLPGTYQLSGPPVPGFLGGPGFAELSVPQGVTLVPAGGGGQAAVNGLAPEAINLGMILSSTTMADFPLPPPGAGQGLANFRPNGVPFLKTPLGDVSVLKNAPDTLIDLAAFFDDPDFTNSLVRFDTTAGPINVRLFDKQAPQTVANFFDYVLSGDYDNSIFHRLVSNPLPDISV